MLINYYFLIKMQYETFERHQNTNNVVVVVYVWSGGGGVCSGGVNSGFWDVSVQIRTTW